MDEHDVRKIIRAVIEDLNSPERHISAVAADFRESQIEYCVIGNMAVRVHNYLRRGEDIDLLVSKKTYPRIEEFLIGKNYSRRPASNRHLYYEFLGGRIPIDIFVEGDVQNDSVLPDPTTSRIQIQKIWYASLPLLMTLKVKMRHFGDILELVRENELHGEFAENLDSDVRENFLQIFRELKGHI